MKKIFVLMLSFCLIFVSVFFAGCGEVETKQDTKTICILGLGDSISAGYAPKNTDLYEYYYDYISGEQSINEMCFTNLLAEQLKTETTNVSTKSYAQSGDKTSDLVERLNNSKAYPTLLTEIKKANAITLCIGANNILGPALDNLLGFMTGEVTEDEVRAELLAGFESFRNDYTNRIIPILTRGKAKVLVMTIYDPFKYFDVHEATVAEQYKENLESLNNSFKQIKTIAIEFLNKINAYIKSQNYQNVKVIDVNAAFETLNKAEYAKYLNVDSSKININNMDDITNLRVNKYLDPHPTLEGQAYIASIYKNAIKDIII